MKSIKERIKKTWVGDIKWKLDRKKASRSYLKAYGRAFNKFSSTNCDKYDDEYLRTRILIVSHSVEKGLCHKQFKAGFGRESISSLCKMIAEYSKRHNKCDYVLCYGTGVLYAYHQRNKEVGYDDSNFVDVSLLIDLDDKYKKGIKKYNVGNVLKIVNNNDFVSFSNSRSSVRLFEFPSKEIEEKELRDAVQLAQNAPSACNRQSTKVYIVLNHSLFDKIEQIQQGCNGFGHNSGAFIFITNDLNYYENAEVKLPVFDAGIFIMNLVYSLHSKGLFTCILNASFPGDAESIIRNMIGIPENEMVNGLVCVSKLEPDVEINVPASVRRSISDMCTIIK